MSVVRVAVPVLHGKRRFHFDKGRPWTILEHIILASLVTAKRMTASEITEKGDIPQQIVIEALIRLMRAGWVQMIQEAGEVQFEPTLRGVAAAPSSELPSIPRRLSRNMNFVIDQITGTIYRNRQLPFVHTWVVQERTAKERIVWIDPPAEPMVEEIRPLVEALFQDDERFVSMDQSGDRLMDRWALITVRDGKPERLPANAPPALRDAITEAAKHARTMADGETRVSIASPAPTTGRSPELPPERPIAFLPSDLVAGGPEHAEALRSALGRARHRVFIHSTFIGREQFEVLETDFRAALDRGVRIDILWGQDVTKEGVRSTRQVVGALRQKLAAEGTDRLVIHPFSTRSHSKLLIADDGSINKLSAWVGTCNWLYSNFRSFEVSVRLRDPGLVSDVLDQLAELSRGANGHWTSLTSEIVGLSANLERSRPLQVAKTTATIVFGNRHAELMRTARDQCAQSLFVTSHRFGAAGGPAVLVPAAAAAKSRKINVELYYETLTTQGAGAQAALSQLLEAGIEPIQREKMHAKLLAWDNDSAVVTSQNWMSADPSDDNPRQEIGVYLKSPGIARTLVDKFHAAVSEVK